MISPPGDIIHTRNNKLSTSAAGSNSTAHTSTVMTGNIKPLTPSSALFDTAAVAPSNIINPPSYNITMKTGQYPQDSNAANTTTTDSKRTTDNSTRPVNTNESTTISDSDCNTASPASSSPQSDFTNNSRRFSFNKRPVFKNGKLQRKSSQISIIHNYPPQRCDSVNHDVDHSKFYMKYKGIMKDKDELPDTAINDLNFEYNYDEKIRAPRMSAASLLSSKDSTHNSLQHHQRQGQQNQSQQLSSSSSQQRIPTTKGARQTSAPALLKRSSNTSSDHTLDSLAEEEIQNQEDSSYKPAAYDLTKQLRRFSLCNYNPKSNEQTSTANNNIFNDSTGSYTYKIQPRKKSVVSNSSSDISPTREKTLKVDDELKPVKQIDEPMKLLDNYVPPVLRPIQGSLLKSQKDDSQNPGKNSSITDSQSSTTSNSSSVVQRKQNNPSISTTPPTADAAASAAAAELLLLKNDVSITQKNNALNKIHTQLLNQLMPSSSSNSTKTTNSNLESSAHSFTSELTPPTSSNSSSDPNVKVKNNNKSIEPSHSHWKPNSSKNSCENCNDTFNLIKRKHHCRHCGGIFCSKCLQHYSNLNLLAHFERPDDTFIPSIHNQLISSLAPIKSTDTADTCTTVNSASTINSSGNNNNTHTNSKNNFKNSGYSKFCKVCPSCYSQWLRFLASDEDYEGKNSHMSDLTDAKLESQEARKESITGVPTDWNWSSF